MTTDLALADDRGELRGLLAQRAGRIGYVPTMGALHDGHASLVRRARSEVGDGGTVVVSIFVNPMQFAPGEDLDRYPRTLEADLGVCRAEGADIVFTPAVGEIYPEARPQVTVDPGPLGQVLEGVWRPTHFRGVLTVVAKFFGLVRPDVAVFGEKDYQQLALIRRMVAELCLGVDVVGAPTVREPDGLALSSRNRYLDPEQREQATVLSRTLYAGRDAAGLGAAAVLSAALVELRQVPAAELDYLELTAPDLGPVPDRGEARLLIAARVGKTRLIDNLALRLGDSTGSTARQGGN